MRDGRYQITERRNAQAPDASDPLAQAIRRHSGMYDLRDYHSSGVICCSSSNIIALRRQQARWNTIDILG